MPPSALKSHGTHRSHLFPTRAGPFLGVLVPSRGVHATELRHWPWKGTSHTTESPDMQQGGHR